MRGKENEHEVHLGFNCSSLAVGELLILEELAADFVKLLDMCEHRVR